MKRLILIITAIFFASILNAQIAFKENETFKTYTGVAGDTLNSSRLLTKSIFLGLKDYAYDYHIQVAADSSGDATDITCRLRGSMDGSTWENIGDAIIWYVTTDDTTFTYSSFTKTNTATATIAQYVITQSAYNIVQDSATIQLNYADTIRVPAITNTVGAQTITTSETYADGVAWRYLQVYFLGAGAGSDMKLTDLKIRILKR